jgi:hypothetical protein
MTASPALTDAEAAAKSAWSRRVRRVGGFIQVGFAALWLIRGSLNIDGGIGVALALFFVVAIIAVIVYGIRATSGAAPRPTGPEAKHIERAVTVATVVQLAASFAAPAIVIAAGRSDWVLPSIAVTIGPLLLWLDHRVDVPRYRPAGWALIVGPLVLVLTMSGSALAATTGIAAGVILLGIAAAGFHDLANARPTRRRGAPAHVPATSRP